TDRQAVRIGRHRPRQLRLLGARHACVPGGRPLPASNLGGTMGPRPAGGGAASARGPGVLRRVGLPSARPRRAGDQLDLDDRRSPAWRQGEDAADLFPGLHGLDPARAAGRLTLPGRAAPALAVSALCLVLTACGAAGANAVSRTPAGAAPSVPSTQLSGSLPPSLSWTRGASFKASVHHQVTAWT